MEAAKAGKPSPAPEAYIMNLCRLFKCLPSEILNEDAELIDRILAVENAYVSVKKAHHDDDVDLHALPDSVKRTLDSLEEMGINAWGL